MHFLVLTKLLIGSKLNYSERSFSYLKIAVKISPTLPKPGCSKASSSWWESGYTWNTGNPRMDGSEIPRGWWSPWSSCYEMQFARWSPGYYTI